MSIKKNVKKLINEVLRYMPIKKKINIPIMYGNLLDKKTALITGGSNGIGLEIAKSFARNGANIIILSRNENKLKKACEIIQSVNINISVDYIVSDISNIKKTENSFHEFIKNNKKKKIDILVNNAGVLSEKNFWNIDEEEFDKVINVDLKGTYFFTRTICKYMIDNKIVGNILNVGSSSSVRPALTPYHFSKWSLRAFTKGLAKEMIKYGIVVNGIAPGPTATNMLLENNDNINRRESPIGRYTTPEEIANLSVILVSDLSKNTIGDTIFATGGCGTLTFDDWN